MTPTEIIGYIGAAVAGAAILAYVGWQIWRAVKRSRKPVPVTHSECAPGEFETVKIDFSNLEMGQQSAVVYSAGGVEQIRIDMDGSVYVKGEKWGTVEIPEEVKS